MQRMLHFLACSFAFLMPGACLAQQYSFIQYSPKDGLVSNRVRHMYQDSKGRLYFCTPGGLSVYDGAKFTNYTLQNGLGSDAVNCVIEMGEDSIWVAANTNRLNCLVKGRMKFLPFAPAPTVNNFSRTLSGEVYAACDDGLFVVEKKGFTRLPFTDMHGRDVNQYLSLLLPFQHYLLVLRDYSLLSKEQKLLYLYDRDKKCSVAELGSFKVYHFSAAPDGRIWIATDKGLKQLNQQALQQAKLKVEDVDPKYSALANKAGYFFFDRNSNCWFSDGLHAVQKCDPNGNITSYADGTGTNPFPVSVIFQDREANIWIAGSGYFVQKLAHPEFSFEQRPAGFNPASAMIFTSPVGDCYLYSSSERQLVLLSNKQKAGYHINEKNIEVLGITHKEFYAINNHAIFRLEKNGSRMTARKIFSEITDNSLGNSVTDRNDNLIITGTHFITSVVGNTVSQIPVSNLSDQLATDSKGNIWAATRGDSLIKFSPQDDRPGNYLKQEGVYAKALKGLSPRSIVVDRKDQLWIGTRFSGIYIYREQNNRLDLVGHLDAQAGLTENFICWLSCDSHNNIWACSPSGLDKISLEKGKLSVENCTRQNNIYQYVLRSMTDNQDVTWAMCSSGLIKVIPETGPPVNYSPSLLLTQLSAGNKPVKGNSSSFHYNENNLNFHFAATSFLDEKQIRYSYQLIGSTNPGWSEATNNASASFIDLRPGDYELNIKAIFPAGRYPEQVMKYHFTIHPPWWKTWWFNLFLVLAAIALLIFIIKSYYNRKLEQQKMMLEKKQAIEKERTRIATDMHDDLGAGLSRIKFLSETIGMKKQQQQPIEEDICKIRDYSQDMITKMGEIVWALNEKNDSLSDLLTYTRAYAVEYLQQNGINCIMQVQEEIEPKFITGDFRRNVFLAIKEILHNIVKHSQANQVWFTIGTNSQLEISITDNGIGFRRSEVRPFSNGIANIEKRIRDIGGHCSIGSDAGTSVRLSLPLQTVGAGT